MFWRKGNRKAHERRALMGTAAGAATIALVAGIAVVAQGYERAEQDLSDASVWVTNTSQGLLGHANTAITSLSTAVKLEGDGVTIGQDKSHVLLHVPDKNTLALVDPAQAETSASVNLPSGSPAVVTAGSWAAILDASEGDLWVRGFNELQGFDPGSDPTGQVGVDAVVAVDQDGRWAGYSQKASRVTVGGSGAPKTEEVHFSQPAQGAQIAVIGGEVAIYNPRSNELWYQGKARSLASLVTDPASARLQASTTHGGRVFVAHDGGLVVADAGSDELEYRNDTEEGTPAAPVRVGNCVYAAWNTGRAQQWCDGRDPEGFSLERAGGIRSLVLRVNEDTVVANDYITGATWAMQRGGALINNWDDFKDERRVIERQRDDLDVPPEPDTAQKPPVAKDDTFGARPGRDNVLPVLLNDSDPNGDPLLIASVGKIPVEQGVLAIVDNGQKVQFTPRADATGSVQFTYTINDGRGGTAEAKVDVRLVPSTENEAPQQARPTKTSVALDGRVSTAVLEDWVDPESDPFYLVSAGADAPNSASSTPDGTVDFTQGGGQPGVDPVRVRVSDGNAVGDGTLNVTVGAKGQTPLIAENYTVTAYAGNEIVTLPVEASRGGTGEITLARAEAAEGAAKDLSITETYTDGRVRITPKTPGSHLITYAVKDDNQQAVGTIRVVAMEAPSGAKDPIVSPTTAFLYVDNTTDVDVLANAFDPGGNVLSISGVQTPPAGSGVVVEVIDREHLRVLLGKDMDKPLTLKVTVSNGTSSTDGDLVLVNVPEPTKLQPPVARDDVVSARAGEIVDIAVLANDTQPDGKPISLSRELVAAPKSGLMVVAGDRLRFLAPDAPGSYTARYQISSADSLTATGTVKIQVRPVDTAGNRAPSAPTVTARTTSGQSVTIPIPVIGADPDGDSVKVSGIVDQPRQGSVVKFVDDAIVYTANPATSGDDSFTYQLVDALGAASVGTVRIGIDGADKPVAPPVAQDDLVTSRPSTDITVDVLSNDVDNDARGLTIVQAQPRSSGLKVAIDGKNLRLKTPSRAGSLAVLYTIADKTGATSYAWLFVDVQRDAPLAAPTTQDRELSLTQVEGKERVPVDVLSGVAFSEGPLSSLKVSLPEGYSDASVLSDGRVEVPVGEEPTIVPFTVSRLDAPDVGSTSFILVPGTKRAVPELRENLPELVVDAGDLLTIPLANFVIAADKRQVRLENTASVTATNGQGSFVKDETTLQYRSKNDYWGTAAITFTVTDGSEQATLVLPITVRSKKNQPPVLRSAKFSVESATSYTLNLREITDLPGGSSQQAALTWKVSGGDPGLITSRVEGDKLIVQAIEGATIGASTTLTMEVTDQNGLKATAPAVVTVSSSKRVPPRALPDSGVVKRGGSVSIDVLANDFSPFPDRSLTVIGVRTETSVAGVSVESVDGGRQIKVSAGEKAATGTTTVFYTIEDITGDPSRQAVGKVQVTVQDVPDAPSSPPVIVQERPTDPSVELSVNGANPNASPITKYEYRINGDDKKSGACAGGAQSCVVKGLEYATDYTFQMRAINGVGAGEWSGSSSRVNMDAKPNAPRNVSGTPSPDDREGHTVVVKWSPPEAANYGSPLKGYLVSISGGGAATGKERSVDANTTTLTFSESWIKPGGRYSLSVKARNTRFVSDAGTGDATAVGAPKVSNAKAGIVGGGNRAQVTWDSDDGGTGARARVLPASKAPNGTSCSIENFSSNASGNSYETTLGAGDERSFVVQVSNGLFCSQAPTQAVDASVGDPSGETRNNAADSGTGKFGFQPQYILRPGNNAGDFFFINLATGGDRPTDKSSGWSKVDTGSWTDFGTQDTDVTVWAMNCRTGSKVFCSDVVKLGTEKKHTEDLGFRVTPPAQCLADGNSKVQITKKQSDVDVEYQWVDENGKVIKGLFDPRWMGLSGDSVDVPERDEGKKAFLHVRSSKGGDLKYAPDSVFASCTGPTPPDPGADANADAGATADAGANADAGATADAGTNADAGATADAGAGTDANAGTTADAAAGANANAGTGG